MKHDWLALKRCYMYSKKYSNVSLRTFALLEGLTYGGNFIHQTKNWRKEKAKKRMQNGYKADAKLDKKIIEKATELNNRYTDIYNDIYEKLKQALEETNIYMDKHGLPQKEKIITSSLKNIAQITNITQQGHRLTLFPHT
ncbi:MAG: hypothetical protein FWC82_04385 [Firmicutes bacterium]|nr:hypothetical protein [Bacillota bacterium]